MQLRIFTEPQQGASYDDLLRLAQATERLGFDAFFRSDHYLAMGSSDGLPGPSDAWITLAGLARETERIRLGTLVSAATFRLPGPLAISVANVDLMSGGRAELGLGTGWFDAEHTAYGIPFAPMGELFTRLEEQVEIVDGLWRTPVGSTYSFEGSYYSLQDAPGLPKPAQSPRPPIILGGSGKKRSAALAARFADEYNVGFKYAQTEQIIGNVRAAADEAGRELVYSAALTVCVGTDEAEFRRRAETIGHDPEELRTEQLGGTVAQVRERLDQLAAWGCTRTYLQYLDFSDLAQLELIAAELL